MTSIIYSDTVEIEWSNPEQPGGGMPGTIDIPIRVRPFDGQEPELISLMHLHLELVARDTQAIHGALRHHPTYEEMIGSIWHNEDERPGPGDIFGDTTGRLGFWGQPYISPVTAPGGSVGWGGMQVWAQRYSTQQGTKPFTVEADGLLCWIRVFSNRLKPGIFQINTNAPKTFGSASILRDPMGRPLELIHEPHYVLIWADNWQPWRREDVLQWLDDRHLERDIKPYEHRPPIDYL